MMFGIWLTIGNHDVYTQRYFSRRTEDGAHRREMERREDKPVSMFGRHGFEHEEFHKRIERLRS